MMAPSLTSIIETRKNRLKRRSGKIFGDVGRSIALVTMTGIVAFVMVYVYNFVITAPYFRLAAIHVRGNSRVAESDIAHLSGIGTTENVLTLNTSEISRKIATHPWIREVRIGRELPDRLVIDVVERTPASFVLMEGTLYIMDRHGDIFKKVENDDDVTLPVLNGMSFQETVDRNLVQQSLLLLEFLAQRKSYPALEHVSEVFGHREYGFSVYTEGGVCLQVGFGNYHRKLERLKPVLVDLSKRNKERIFICIDLTDTDRVVVKRSDLFKRDRLTKSFET